MGAQKDCKFCVIELLEPPYSDPERYVCVPNSWIRLRETSDGVAIVKFPIEELSEVKKLAKNEEFSDNWTIFLADIKYSTNSYKDACMYVKILNKISIQEQNNTKTVEDTPSTSDMKVLESQPSSETNEVRTTSTLSSSAEPVNNETTNQQKLGDTNVEICQETNQIQVDSSPKPRRYLTRQALRMSSSTNSPVSSLDQTVRDNRPVTSNCVEESVKTNHNQENEPTVKKPSELSRKLQIDAALRTVLGDNYKGVLKQLRNEFERNLIIIESLQLKLVESVNHINGLIKITDEINSSPYINEVSVIELEKNMSEVNIHENNLDEVTGSKVQNDAQNEKKKEPNSDSTEVKNNNPLNNIRGKARKFTLPPEYDPDDSRWTLKHREMKKGLVELLPLSRVYVDAIKLSHCKTTAQDSKILARMLLLEIFSKNALSICSLTGKKANAFDYEGADVRPGLDEHTRTVLMTYVKKHALHKKWAKFEPNTITNALRNKLQEIRGKSLNLD